jgi:hypothetical protein
MTHKLQSHKHSYETDDSSQHSVGAGPVGPLQYPWSDSARAPSGLALIVGVWLMLSPLVIHYDAALVWNPLICYALVTAVSIWRVSWYGRSGMLLIATVAIGVWLVVSGVWLADAYSWRAITSLVGTGVILVFVALVSLAITAQRTGR